MRLRLQLSPSQQEDYKIISRIPPDRLARAVEILANNAGKMLRPAEVRAAIQEVVEAAQARAIVKQSISLLTIRRRRRTEVSALVAAVTEALGDGWEPADLDKWRSVEPIFERLLKTDSVAVVAKALSLSYDYANLMEGARVLTDVRPVYNDRRAKVVGALISQVLRVDYSSDDGLHTISIAMNEEDLASLKDACDEAFKKAREARRLVNEDLKLAAFIAGEENYDAD